MSVTAKNSLFDWPEEKRLSMMVQMPCIICGETLENFQPSKSDPEYLKICSQHLDNCSIFCMHEYEPEIDHETDTLQSRCKKCLKQEES
jgi:hypothetical protein